MFWNEFASGAPLLPFRGVDDYMNATEGTAKAREILAPVLPLLQTIHSADFSFMAATGWPAENLWDSLYKDYSVRLRDLSHLERLSHGHYDASLRQLRQPAALPHHAQGV